MIYSSFGKASGVFLTENQVISLKLWVTTERDFEKYHLWAFQAIKDKLNVKNEASALYSLSEAEHETLQAWTESIHCKREAELKVKFNEYRNSHSVNSKLKFMKELAKEDFVDDREAYTLTEAAKKVAKIISYSVSWSGRD